MQYSRPLETREDLDLWAPTFLAGQFGEVVLLGFAGPGASQDNAMVTEQIGAFVGRDDAGRTFFQTAFQQSQRLVQQHASAVRLVANTLIQKETLYRADIEALLGRTG